VIEACKTEGCTAKKFVVNSWEHYGEDNFNNLTYGQSTGEHSTSDHTEGICPECGKPVVYKDYFVITSDANALKIAFEAYYYARDVLNAPFPEGETLIATDAEYSYKYAKDILKKPFPLGEAAIATDAKYSCHYSQDVLHAPFLLGEKIIATNEYYFKKYKELFPEPQVVATPEPQAPDSINIVSGFYLKEKTSMSDKQKQKDVIKSTFLTLVYTLEEIIEYDQENDKYFWVGSLFDADRILQSINDLMETFPELTQDLALQEYDELKSYMDEYSKYRKEKQEKEKTHV
jgi:lambda repressor-like predicted transcriptional regulator